MRSNLKHLSFGLVIGLFFSGALILEMVYITADVLAEPVIPFPPILQSVTNTVTTIELLQNPTNTPPPIISATSTATLIPPSTQRPATATLTVIEQMVAEGDLVFTGPLTSDQQIRLYETSLQFIARTAKRAKQVGETINGAGYGSPTLICGPLSLAILQSTGLVEAEGVVPADFWLLNPELFKTRTLLNRVFPEDRFENKVFQSPLSEVDWRTYPLRPGDFLYIRHGSYGNFDHALVVSRVDKFGRAYAVTNYSTDDGYIINEVMLYDPGYPNVGIFHTWTERPFAASGSTGFGGFEIWRTRTPY